jgi:hypothetical protein
MAVAPPAVAARIFASAPTLGPEYYSINRAFTEPVVTAASGGVSGDGLGAGKAQDQKLRHRPVVFSLPESPKKLIQCELLHTLARSRPDILGLPNRSGTMKKLIFTLIITTAVIGGVVAFTTPYHAPAKATTEAGIDPFLIMSHAVNLPVARYDDYSLVFTPGSDAVPSRD